MAKINIFRAVSIILIFCYTTAFAQTGYYEKVFYLFSICFNDAFHLFL